MFARPLYFTLPPSCVDHMHGPLQPVLLLLALAVAVVVLFRLLKQPPILGYLLVGIVIGPHALRWIPANANTDVLGEIGVVFLMFSIGLEFSLPKLKAMKQSVLGMGGAHLGITLLVVMLGAWYLDLSWQSGLILGAALTMSSTAIVSKLLAERLELEKPHGRHVFGVLLFQDLAVVPFLILVPALGGALSGAALASKLGMSLLIAVGVLLLVFTLGDKLIRRWFHLVAQQRSSELFILNVLLIALGVAWLTSLAGLSLALGAFLAGMLIGETEYRFEVEDAIRPFRDVLLGLFFVTIGMKLDVSEVLHHGHFVALFLLLLVPGKIVIVTFIARILGNPAGVALRTGLYLGQAGEFGFVLLALAAQSPGLLPDALQQSLLAAMVLAMLIAPFLIQKSDAIVLRLVKSEWMNQSLVLHQIAIRSMDQDGHVLVCGYGRSGQSLGRLLRAEEISFIALDLDPERIREANAAGESVVFGDSGKKEALVAAGLKRAKSVVISFCDTPLSLKIIAHIHSLRPELPIIVRTRDDTDVATLKNAGATEVVADIMEGSLMLASHTMVLLGLPLSKVVRRIRDTREQRYDLFRGFFQSSEDLGSEHFQPRLHSLHLPPQAYAVGRTVIDLDLASLNVELRTLRRRHTAPHSPLPDTVLFGEDTLVLLGTPENLAAAESRLLQGG